VRLVGFTIKKGYLRVFRELVENIQVLFKYHKNNGYFAVIPMYIYDNISLLSSSSKKYSRQVVKEDKNTLFIINNFSPQKIVPFMKKKKKIRWTRTGNIMWYMPFAC
jgi:hypothetical protein